MTLKRVCPSVCQFVHCLLHDHAINANCMRMHHWSYFAPSELCCLCPRRIFFIQHYAPRICRGTNSFLNFSYLKKIKINGKTTTLHRQDNNNNSNNHKTRQTIRFYSLVLGRKVAQAGGPRLHQRTTIALWENIFLMIKLQIRPCQCILSLSDESADFK